MTLPSNIQDIHHLNRWPAVVKVGLVALAMLVGTFALTSPVAAKRPVDKITIEGQHLTAPIEITDETSLEPFSPWFRQFIDWKQRRIKTPPTVEQTYEVSFHLNDRGVIFVLEYSTDPSGGPGYIYIPGPGEPGYRLNIGTIITGDSDSWNPNGQWQHATPEWGTLMRQAIGQSPEPQSTSNGAWAPPAWALALAGLALVGAATVSLRLRRRPA